MQKEANESFCCGHAHSESGKKKDILKNKRYIYIYILLKV